METVECIIAGAGAIGLAVGRALARRGHEVLLVEANGDYGLETSARNSEVIHAGIYYPAGSLKARHCREGRGLLIDYLREKGLPHRLCGKLIVAPSADQHGRLAEIEARAIANGVTALKWLDASAVHALEPSLAPVTALFSPETGIFDSRAYLGALLEDVTDGGGQLALNTRVVAVTPGSAGHRVDTVGADGQGFSLRCRRFVNATGLQASHLARAIAGSGWNVPETRYARGTYYQVSGRSDFRHLVYPVPEPGGLGVHLTLDMGGTIRFGPDVEWIDVPDYRIDDHRRQHFASAIARYWPDVARRDLTPAYCGVRPKLTRPGDADADFLIAGQETHGIPDMVQLFGIESPGLTASLAIAGETVRRLGLG